MACCPALPPHFHNFIERPRLPDHRYLLTGTPAFTLLRENQDCDTYYAILYKPFGIVVSLFHDQLPTIVTTDPKERTPASLRLPRVLSDQTIHYAFYPTDPRMGALFDPINLTIAEIDALINPIEVNTFMLSAPLVSEWLRLETFLRRIGKSLLYHFCYKHPKMAHHIDIVQLPDIVDPMIVGSRETIHSRVLEILTSFRILSAFVSFTFALWHNPAAEQPFADAHSYLGSHFSTYSLSTAYLVHTSAILDFTTTPRSGGFINPFTTRWGAVLHKFAPLGVPIWLPWGPTPCYMYEEMTLPPRLCPPNLVIARARQRALHDHSTSPLLTTLLESFEIPKYNSLSRVHPPRDDTRLSYWHEPSPEIPLVPSSPRNRPPISWRNHCELHTRYEDMAYQDTRSDDVTVEQVRQLGSKAMESGFSDGMSFYMWENKASEERVWIVPYGVPLVWDTCKCRIYWPFAKEWDVTPFQDFIPHGAVPGFQSIVDPQFQHAPVRLPPPATTTPYPTTLSTFQLRNNPAPNLREYLRCRHGYSCDIPGTNDAWYTSRPEPPNSSRPLVHLLYSNQRLSMGHENAAAAVDWYNVLSNEDVGRQHLSARWDIRANAPCFIRPTSFWYTLASTPQGSTVYLFHANLYPFKLVLSSATAVLMIFRNSHWDTLRKVILGLLDLGVPFSTAIPRPQGAPPLVRPIHTPAEPLFCPDVTEADDESTYDAYVAVLKELLRTPLGRAARERAGILGRLAKDIVSDEDVLHGPAFATELVALDGQTFYYADPMPDAAAEVIIGAFRSENGIYSYWPPPSAWDSSSLAGDQWLPDAETWFASREGEQPSATVTWDTALPSSQEGKLVLQASERLAAAFIANHMAVLANPPSSI